MPGRWNWTDAAIFIAVFTAVRLVFIGLATRAILALVPSGTRCDTCGGETHPLRAEGAWRVLHWRPLATRFHRRFCLSCGWDGIAQHTTRRAAPAPAAPPVVAPLTPTKRR